MMLEDDELALYEGGQFELKEGGEVVEGLVLKVGPGASVSGRVYDAVTREGIPDVKIITYGGRRSVETDEEGRYRLVGIDAGPRRLNLANTGFSSSTQIL